MDEEGGKRREKVSEVVTPPSSPASGQQRGRTAADYGQKFE